MSIDQEVLEQFKLSLADKYTASELVEFLNLDVWEILEAFQDEVMELYSR